MLWAIEQYHRDLIKKMNLNLNQKHLLLDVGCGNGEFTKYLTDTYNLQSKGVDVDRKWKNIHYNNVQFSKGSIYELPFEQNMFDYVFLKDILHHIDEPKHELTQFKKAFNEIKRVCKPNGRIIILESNRYNPISYPNMVLLKGHDHFKYKKLVSIINNNFNDYKLINFEAHVYPKFSNTIFKFYEYVMEKKIPRKFRAYTLINALNKDM